MKFPVEICKAVFANHKFQGLSNIAYMSLLTILETPNALLMKPLTTFVETYCYDPKLLDIVSEYESSFSSIMQHIHTCDNPQFLRPCELKIQALELYMFYKALNISDWKKFYKIYKRIDINSIYDIEILFDIELQLQ